MNVQAILTVLRDENREFEWDDVWDKLGSIDASFRSELPQLRTALSDANPFVCIFALRAITRIGGDLSEVVPEVIPLLKDNQQDVRAEATKFLKQFGQHCASTVIPEVIPLLKDSQQDVRAEATKFLEQFGQHCASTVIPALRQLANDGDAFLTVRLRAFIVLLKLKCHARDQMPSEAMNKSQYRAQLFRVIFALTGSYFCFSVFWILSVVPKIIPVGTGSDQLDWKSLATIVRVLILVMPFPLTCYILVPVFFVIFFWGMDVRTGETPWFILGGVIFLFFIASGVTIARVLLEMFSVAIQPPCSTVGIINNIILGVAMITIAWKVARKSRSQKTK